MFRCNHHHQGAHYSILPKLHFYNNHLKYIDVVNSVVWLHMQAFNVNFKIVFKTIDLCISW
jgi:hypothetical protein